MVRERGFGLSRETKLDLVLSSNGPLWLSSGERVQQGENSLKPGIWSGESKGDVTGGCVSQGLKARERVGISLSAMGSQWSIETMTGMI